MILYPEFILLYTYYLYNSTKIIPLQPWIDFEKSSRVTL